MKSLYKKVVTPLIIIGFALYLIPSAFAKGVDPEEKVYYYLSDHLGGVDAVLDEEGNVVERRDYLPYGSERMTEGGIDEDYGFTGKELDEETGLYYYGARYYDPAIGRFVSLDPLVLGESEKSLNSILADPQALNGHSYVLNNPLRYVDETGEYKEDVHYILTYYLGIKAGLSDNMAGEIAFFNDRVDTNPATAPTNPENVESGVTKERHFTNESVATAHVYAAIAKKDPRYLGDALHSFQDTYSHRGLNEIKHASLSLEQMFDDFVGLNGSTDPDITANNSRKATFMAFNTFNFIREFKRYNSGIKDEDAIRKYNAETQKIWQNISGDINTFLEAEDKTATDIYAKIHNDDKKEE